jgi:hypothetical protein
MKASIVVLTGGLFLYSWATASAQTSSNAPQGLTWTHVDHCPAANALGPRAYADVGNKRPGTVDEMNQLIDALTACSKTPVQDQSAEEQSGEVIPDDAPPDSAAIARALQFTEQVFVAFLNGTNPNGTLPNAVSAVPPNSAPSDDQPSAAQPSYAAPSYAAPSYSQPSYAQPSYAMPSYARPLPTYVAPASYSAPRYSYSPPVYIYVRPSYARRYPAPRPVAAVRVWWGP